MKGQLSITADTSFSLREEARHSLHVDCFLLCYEDVQQGLKLPGLSEGELEHMQHAVAARKWQAKQGDVLEFNDPSMLVVGVGHQAKRTHLVVRDAVATLTRRARQAHMRSMSIFLPAEWIDDAATWGTAVSGGYHLGNYAFDSYKSEKHKERHVEEMHVIIIGDMSQDDVNTFEMGCEVGEMEVAGVYLARDIVNQPAAEMTPDTLVGVAREIAENSAGRISLKVLDEASCRRLGMGAYLGVAQGSALPPRFIVLKYAPKAITKTTPTYCFVGKSITFDTGGLSLKPADAMVDMKIDMAGGAAVLGTFQSLAVMSQQEVGVNAIVYGILPACENMPSGQAMRPGDIVRAMDGQTIEVLNTDAEGRLTLADALVYAQKKIKPTYLVDLATLTGACMIGLGTGIAGVWGNHETLLRAFADSAASVGDAAWTMPLHKPYKKSLKSHVADVSNIANTKYGGAITAALFLDEFVDEQMPWVHVDMAGPAYRNGEASGIYAHGATGWGVLTLLSLVMEEELA